MAQSVPTASSLMWTAPEGASAIYSAGARSVAAPTSEVSPVRSRLAARPPGTLRHNRATPARHRVLPPSRCLRGRRAGCPATPETGPAGPPASAPRQPTVAVDCADRQAGGIGQPPAASSAQRIASPEMLPWPDPLPHLICSPPIFIGGGGHGADQHGDTRRTGGCIGGTLRVEQPEGAWTDPGRIRRREWPASQARDAVASRGTIRQAIGASSVGLSRQRRSVGACAVHGCA
jgi:hypothetical protein